MARATKVKSGAKKTTAVKAKSVKKSVVKKPIKVVKAKKQTKKTTRINFGTEELQFRTQNKAYEIFEQRGQSHGSDFDDWLEAEKLVLAEA